MKPQSYLIFLGQASDLAFAELSAVVSAQNCPKPERLLESVAFVPEYDGDIQQLQNTLGGCVKIARIIDQFSSLSSRGTEGSSNLITHPTLEDSSLHIRSVLNDKGIDEEEVMQVIQQFLESQLEKHDSKITFSIASVGKVPQSLNSSTITEGVKQWFSAQDRSTRFVIGKQGGLSSVQLDHNNILKRGFDLILVGNEKTLVLAETVAFQDYKAWSKRDFGRPKADPKRGMLPPKLARIMVNIARGTLGVARGEVLLDPFCGEGTVLQEGLEVGCTVIGSDIDQKAIADAKTNLDWYKKTIVRQDVEVKIFQADVSQLRRKIDSHSVDVIVTEPFLGDPARDVLPKDKIDKITREYSRLFGMLINQADHVLKTDGIIAIVVPVALKGKFSQRLLRQSELDTCEKNGYTLLEGPFSYHRSDAKIGREIYFFRKSS